VKAQKAAKSRSERACNFTDEAGWCKLGERYRSRHNLRRWYNSAAIDNLQRKENQGKLG
jgi:hypothetical protein